MKGDFSRLTFDPSRHYDGVLHQQGRVWLDADWNEDVQSRLYLLKWETGDLVGACGAPIASQDGTHEETPDFRIEPGATPDDFVIRGGRCYVKGFLCRLDQDISYRSQPDFPDPPPTPPASASDRYARVYVETWQRLITYLEDDALREVALGGPDTAARVQTVAQVKFVEISASDLPLNPTIDPTATPPTGLETLCHAAEAHLPADGPGGGTLTTLQPPLTLPPDPCRLPDPSLYTGRENRLYRVEIHSGGDLQGSGSTFRIALAADALAGATTLTLAAALTSDQANALLASGLIFLSQDDGLNEIAPITAASGTNITLARGLTAAFVTAQNAVLSGGVALFKWSRDNAAFAARVTTIGTDRTRLTLSTLGRDQATTLKKGDLVEITDDAAELGPGHGLLTYLAADPDPTAQGVTLADALPTNFQVGGTVSGSTTAPERHLILRRWDGIGSAAPTYDDVATPGMNLSDGVHIHFGGSGLRAGDYWQFTARVDGTIQALSDAPPAGIARYHCPLAVVRWSTTEGAWSFEPLADCRQKFPSLTELICLSRVGGNGQIVMPDLSANPPTAAVSLDRPLQVGVSNGQWPVEGARILFRITTDDGSGVLQANSPSLGPTPGRAVVALTNADGLAECQWRPDWTTRTQQVEAVLLRGDGQPWQHLPIRFLASRIGADQVAYDPGQCAGLQGQTTVQKALDRLSRQVRLYAVSGDGQEVTTQPLQPLVVLAANACGPTPGVTITFTVEAGGGSVTPASAVTDANGQASCSWTLGPGPGTQVVAAAIQPDPAYTTAPPTVARFTAFRGGDIEPGILVTDVVVDPNGVNMHMALGTIISADVLARGLRVTCSDPLNPDTLVGDFLSPSCFVTVQQPQFIDEPSGFYGYQPLILAASVGVNAALIAWNPIPDAQSFLVHNLSQRFGRTGGRTLACLTLKGNFIRDANETEWLDGEIFAPLPNHPELPSGNGRRGGDFELWFWITQGIFLSGLALNPTVIFLAQPAIGTVTLNAPATVDMAITLTADNPALVTLPAAAVLVPAGQAQATFTVIGVAPGTATISAQLGTDVFQAALTIEPPILLGRRRGAARPSPKK
jgi:hypothetical protein